jgi:hypothetical protein
VANEVTVTATLSYAGLWRVTNGIVCQKRSHTPGPLHPGLPGRWTGCHLTGGAEGRTRTTIWKRP